MKGSRVEAIAGFAHQSSSTNSFHVPPIQTSKTKCICLYEIPSFGYRLLQELLTHIQVVRCFAQWARGGFGLLFLPAVYVAVC